MLPINLLASPLARYGLLALGALAAVGVAYSWAFGRGRDACETDHQAALAESLQRGLEQAQEIARQDAEVSEYYERMRTRTLTKVTEVTREIPADCLKCGIGSNGLRLINEARGFDSPAADAPQQPDGGLPATPKGGVGQAPRSGGTPLTHEPRLLRLRHAPSPVGGTGQGTGGA